VDGAQKCPQIAIYIQPEVEERGLKENQQKKI
jgi:hypothetical protein